MPASTSIQDKKIQLEKAYIEHSDALLRYCTYKLSEQELAKDVLQDAFIRAWQYLKRNIPVDNIRAFLYKIVSNLVIDAYRKRKPIDSLETLREEGFDAKFDNTHNWFDIFDGKKAVKLLNKIPAPYGRAVFMRYMQELSLKEISAITGERENTVAVHIHRGLEKLRILFHQDKNKNTAMA